MNNISINKPSMIQLLKAGFGLSFIHKQFRGEIKSQTEKSTAYIIQYGRNQEEHFGFVKGNEKYQDIAIEATVDRFLELIVSENDRAGVNVNVNVKVTPEVKTPITIPPVTAQTRVFPYE